MPGNADSGRWKVNAAIRADIERDIREIPDYHGKYRDLALKYGLTISRISQIKLKYRKVKGVWERPLGDQRRRNKSGPVPA